MLFPAAILARIASGEVKLAFRRWRRPTVKTGGRLRTPVGVLAIDAVEAWSVERITDGEARAAGHVGRDALLRELSRREGDLFRIAFHVAGGDPRTALMSQDRLTEADFHAIRQALDGLDRRVAGPWTRRLLGLIAEREGVEAARLAQELGVAKPGLKADVRKLKELGLTEALPRGYRLSLRGRAVLARWGI